MLSAGKLTVLSILTVALFLAAWTVWYQHQMSRRVLELWGPEVAALIARSPQVELLELDASSDPANPDVLSRKNVHAVLGINNVRHALVQDSTYDWTNTGLKIDAPWQAALRFVDGPQEATVLFSFDDCRTAMLGGPRVASLHPVACAELRAFVREQQ